MDEYIRKQDVIRKVLSLFITEDEKLLIISRMKSIPDADVRPVKRGHWVKRMEEHVMPKYTSFTPIWSCSECGLDYDPALAPRIHFCYNCGADLREG